MKFIILLFSLLSCEYSKLEQYDEKREIDLIHGIKKDFEFTKKYQSKIKLWSHSHQIPIPKLSIFETTPLQAQGYYAENHIYIYFSEKERKEDILATLAHEFAHHYFYHKRIIMDLREEELEADKFASTLIGKELVIRNLQKRKFYHENDIHPQIIERIRYINH